MNHFKHLFLSAFLMMFTASVYAEAIKEHPLIRPFPGSVLAENMSKYNKFNAARAVGPALSRPWQSQARAMSARSSAPGRSA